ncbi:MAG: hypothetical protein PHI85_06495 [Victivallaceae bacterium]|nr:hypothetical protein [Victivallaceae bacterium]
MKSAIKRIFSTPAGRLGGAAAVMLISLLLLAANSLNFSGGWLSGASGVRQLQGELAAKYEKYNQLAAADNALKAREKQYSALLSSCLRQSDAGEYGDPAELLRRNAEKSAAAAGLRLNNAGAVRAGSLNSEITSYELELSGSAAPETIVEFLLAVNNAEPRAQWRKFELRSGRGPGSDSGSLNFSGTLILLEYRGNGGNGK